MNPGSGRRPKWLGTAVAAFLTLLIVSQPFWINFEGSGMYMDEGTLLLYPELMARGKLPYRDFETFYGPLNLWTLSAAYSAFGLNVFVERGMGVAYRLLLLLGVFLLGRRAGLGVAVGCTVCAGIVLSETSIPAFAWLGGVACLLFSALLLAGEGRRGVIFSGVLGGAAVLFRADLGLALILSATPLLWRLSGALRWRYVAGFAAGLTPLALLALLAGPLATLNNLFLYPVFRTSAGRRLALGGAPQWILSLVIIHIVASVAAVVAGAMMWKRQPRSVHGPLLLSVGLLALGLTHQALQRVDSLHVACTAFLAVGLLPWIFQVFMRRGEDVPGKPWSALACGAAAVGLLALAAMPMVRGCGLRFAGALVGTKMNSVFVREGDRQFPISPLYRAAQVSKVMEILKTQTRPGQRLFVGPGDLRRTHSNDTFIYHLAPWLVPSTYFLEMNPLSANRTDSRLAADVATADWLVLDRLLDRWVEANASAINGSDAPNEVVRTQFESVHRVGDFEIYRRKQPAGLAAGVPAS